MAQIEYFQYYEYFGIHLTTFKLHYASKCELQWPSEPNRKAIEMLMCMTGDNMVIMQPLNVWAKRAFAIAERLP